MNRQSSSVEAMHSTTDASSGSKPMLDKPKRPLSGYNHFFRDEREKLLLMLPATKLPVRSKKGRKTHHKINFSDLAKTIATRWKSLDKSAKREYEDIAEIGRQIYHERTKAWKEQQKALGMSTKILNRRKSSSSKSKNTTNGKQSATTTKTKDIRHTSSATVFHNFALATDEPANGNGSEVLEDLEPLPFEQDPPPFERDPPPFERDPLPFHHQGQVTTLPADPFSIGSGPTQSVGGRFQSVGDVAAAPSFPFFVSAITPQENRMHNARRCGGQQGHVDPFLHDDVRRTQRASPTVYISRMGSMSANTAWGDRSYSLQNNGTPLWAGDTSFLQPNREW